MRIAHVRGEEPIKKSKQSFQEKVQELKQLFITEHNRKIERERNKNNKR